MHSGKHNYYYTHFALVPSEEKTTPENRTIQNIIQALFTPYLTKLITRVPTNEVSTITVLCDCHITSHAYIHPLAAVEDFEQ